MSEYSCVSVYFKVNKFSGIHTSVGDFSEEYQRRTYSIGKALGYYVSAAVGAG